MTSEKAKKLNNKGASLILVIVVVAFISILATTILYIAGSNFITKSTDRKTKENFYEAETAIEEIKAGFILMAAEAADKAYMKTVVEYSSDPFTRAYNYQEYYFEELDNMWKAKKNNPAAPKKYLDLVREMVDTPYRSSVTHTSAYTDDSFGTLERDATGKFMFIKGVKVEYINSEGYTTAITTDISFKVPTINWSLDQSLLSPSYTPTPGVVIDSERKIYDISEFVNYSNWQKE